MGQWFDGGWLDLRLWSPGTWVTDRMAFDELGQDGLVV